MKLNTIFLIGVLLVPNFLKAMKIEKKTESLVKKRRDSFIKKLEEKFPEIKEDLNTSFNSKNDTTLIKAAKALDKELVKALIDDGADLNKQNNSGNTALIEVMAANPYSIGDTFAHSSTPENEIARAIAELLIKAGIDINLKNNDDDTALMVALTTGYYTVARLLIKQGAEVNTSNKEKETPLIIAQAYRKQDIVELLQEKGALSNT